MVWILFLIAIAGICAFSCVRKLSPGEWGRVVRFGKVKTKGKNGRIVFLYPLIDKFERISIRPFSVSLSPQSAITKDEIPIQVQASLEARILDPQLAIAQVRNWQIFLMSQLQDLIKEKLEQFGSDTIWSNFNNFADSIRKEMAAKSALIGVELVNVDISNLSSPKTHE